MSTLSRITLRRPVALKRARRPEIAPSPIVKWAGGKSKLLEELTRRRPTGFRRYFEPFAGGAALFFRMVPQRAVLGDTNADLINMYRCVAWNVEGVMRRLAAHRRSHCEDYYYQVREKWNDAAQNQSDVARAAAFIYMNKTCYNGLWRVNRKGLFNVPIGRYTEPRIYDPAAMRAASIALQHTDLRVGTYAETIEDAGRNDFVYFDPPYVPLTETANFTSYTADDFGCEDQEQLATTAQLLDKRGCYFMLSNHDTPRVRELYADFHIDTVQCTRAINSNAAKRGSVTEVVITNV